jgi:1,4-dihydroxy-2-naphthoate octaprenyltransferase
MRRTLAILLEDEFSLVLFVLVLSTTAVLSSLSLVLRHLRGD